MKPFESSRSKNKFLKICVAADHSVQLVGIADALGDPPFVGGRYSNASRNYSATRRLLHFIANLIFPFRAQHTGTKNDLQVDRRLANWAQRSSGLHFFVLFSRLVPSYQVVSMLCLKLQIPET
ncbi:hypothetical protein H5410_050855 [Solanum commersonii]|uniref:Uncharacterized protein n=1 Tax=Solanum commersonii TaxID=4109 RepID=A0A9J5WYU1_SOLCO|nr:hypothetical protein H5410_050855 [Solanum commersonii]